MARYLVSFTVKTGGREIHYYFLTENKSKKDALAAASAAWYSKREEEGYHKMYFKKAERVEGETAEIFSVHRDNVFYQFLDKCN